MKNYYLFIAAFFISAMSFAQVLLTEDFDYNLSSGNLTADSGSEWIAHSPGTPTVGYSDTGLNMTDYPVSTDTGAAIIANSNGEAVSVPFVAVNPGKLFYSALVNLSSVGAGDSGFFMHLKSASGSAADYRARVFAKDDGANGINFGIISQGSNANISWTLGSYNLNTTYLIVVSYDTITGISNLFVLTEPTLVEPTPVASHTAVAVSEFDSFAIRQHVNGPVGTIDGIRVTTEWEYLMISIALSDGPANGAILTASPETANNANIDFATTSFDMSDDSGDGITGNPATGMGFIKWELKDIDDNSVPDSGNIFTSNNNSITYSVTGIEKGKTYQLIARLVDNDGNLFPDLDFVYTITFTVANYIDVNNLADLRGQNYDETTFFRVTGPVTNTYSRGVAYNNQQYFQDGTAGILVADPNYEIFTYNEGDVVSNIKGQLFEGGDGVLRLIPTEINWEAASVNIPIIPEVVTTEQINNNFEDYESELVEIKNATFQFPGGNFAIFHPINDGSGSNFSFFCGFQEANYIGALIPSTPQDIIGIVNEFNSLPRITARNSLDFTLETKVFQMVDFKLYPNPSSLGYVNISSGNLSKLDIRIFDILGKQIKKEIVSNSKLIVSDLKPGIYLLRIKQDDATVTKKIIIE